MLGGIIINRKTKNIRANEAITQINVLIPTIAAITGNHFTKTKANT